MEPKKLSILAIQKIRKSSERKTDDIRTRDKNFMNYIKYLLTCDGNEHLQMEAAWIFTNIAAGSTEQTKIVVDYDVPQLLIKLLSSTNIELVEQAIWALGNIIGDDKKYRDLMLNLGVLEPLLSLVTDIMPVSFQRTIVWVLVNIVRHREISLNVLEIIIPKLCQLAVRQDTTTKIDALWALTFIADNGEDYIQRIVDNDIIGEVIWMLSSQNQKLQISAMRFLGNIATGSDDQTQVLLDSGILNNMRPTLIQNNRNLRRVALWCLSNISIGTQSQAQEVFRSGLLSLIIDNLTNRYDTDLKIVKEAVFTVRNLIRAGTVDQMLDLIEGRCINALFTLLLNEELEISEAARVSLEELFVKCGYLIEKYSQMRLLQNSFSV